MCLTIKSTKASDLFGDKEKIICWKMMQPCGRSVFMGSPYKIGGNLSNRVSAKITRIEELKKEITNGLHVYLNKNEAKLNSIPGELIVSVVCYKKDFIAIGEKYDAVFHRVYLSRRQFAKFGVKDAIK
jgi:hypothetical protein